MEELEDGQVANMCYLPSCDTGGRSAGVETLDDGNMYEYIYKLMREIYLKKTGRNIERTR